MAAVGGDGAETACGDAADAVSTHQALDPAAAGHATLCAQRRVEARAAVAATMALVKATDVGQQRTVRARPHALGPATPSVVAAGRHAEHTAHEPDRVLLPVVLDETKPHLGASEKMAIAFFKTSRS